MDLCGPMRIQSINGRKYILVIVDDYSRFTWVKFSRSKDEVSELVIKFLKMIQVRLNVIVRIIRTDNGTEFVNHTLRAYYEEAKISHQIYVARTPQQNGVVERWNCTLVEVARTMLIFLKALKPDLSYLHVFGALCYPTNDGEDLGPGPKLLTPGIISLGLVQNIPSSTLYVPPTKNDWEILFQPMFDGSPSSTTIDQDALSTSTSQTNQETLSPVIPLGVEEASHDIKVAHMDNNPYVDFPTPEPSSEESST
ncbi:retrovirus-related pol polyprotein from transposon TNT 1-94 [Tanacetum coccineum]